MWASCGHHAAINATAPCLQMPISLVKAFFKTVTAIKTAQRGIVMNAAVT